MKSARVAEQAEDVEDAMNKEHFETNADLVIFGQVGLEVMGDVHQGVHLRGGCDHPCCLRVRFINLCRD